MNPDFSRKAYQLDPGTTVLHPFSGLLRLLIAIAMLLASTGYSLAVAPTLSAMEGTTITYNEGAAAATITSLLNVGDVDSPNLQSAIVQITAGFLSTEDLLSFTTSPGITGVYDASTGTITFTGLASLTNYRNTLRSVKYQNTNNNDPSNAARTIAFTVNDGGANSNTASRTVNVVPVNDAPALTALEGASLSFTEGDPATVISNNLIVGDVDNTTLVSATVAITGNFQNTQDLLAFTNAFGITGSFSGSTLTLTGVATLADYQAALRSVTYQNTNTFNPNITTRTFTVRVNDGSLQSASVTRTITITPTNDAPILSAIEATNVAYSEGAPAATITSTINIVDDDVNINGATVQITSNNVNTEDVLTFTVVAGITQTFDATTGTLEMTGPASVTNYRNALRGVKYSNSNLNNPSTAVRTISFTVRDITDNSNSLSRNITVSGVNDVPVVSNFEPAALTFTEGDAATPISSTLNVVDVDDPPYLVSATVAITGYVAGQDILAFTNAFGITGSWSAGTLTLAGNSSVANYQAALRSVTYQNTNTYNPSVAARSISVRVNDGVVQSVAHVRTLTVAGVNDGAVLSAIETTNVNFTAGTATPVTVTGTLAVVDDGTSLQSATVQISANYVSAEDILTYSIPGGSGITANFDSGTGTLTFTGPGTVANFQSALRSVRYRNSNGVQASPLTRTISFAAFDGSLASNTVSRKVVVAAKRPIVTDEEVDIEFPVAAYDASVNGNIDISSITIITNPAQGTVTVDNTLGTIKYHPDVEFSGTNTVTYTIKDLNGITSGVVTATITVNLINDAPYFTLGSDITANEDAPTQTFLNWASNINDGDPWNGQTLTFSYVNSNTALFSSGPSINTTTGTLTFKSATNRSGVATIQVTLKDNGSNTPPHVNTSVTKTFTITVLSVNDAPVGVDDNYSTSSGTPLSANALSNDTDTEGDVLSLSPTPIVAPAHGSVVLGANGTFVYTPDASYTGNDSFTYQVCDNGTDNGVPASQCGQAVVYVTVNPQNSNWNIVGNNSIELGPNDFILTKALNNQQGAIWNRNPLDLHYSFDLALNAIFSEPGVVHDDGADGIAFVFQRDTTPPPLNIPMSPIYARGQTGGAIGVGGIVPSLGIEVDTYQNVNDPVYDHIAVNKDGDVTNNLVPPVAAKLDASNVPVEIEDGVWHTINIHWDYPTRTFSVSFDGVHRVVYTNDIVATVFNSKPKGVYWGFSSATGGKNNYQAVKDIAMTVINLSPVATTDVASIDEDGVLNGTSVMANDFDPEATPITITAETKATAHGQVVINADGTYVYTPNADYSGSDSFTYQICDSYSPAACVTGTVDITINAIQDAPVAHDDSFTTPEDTKLIVTCDCVLHNDIDVDGETMTAVVVENVKHGTLSFNTDGSFEYMPDQDFFGTDTFTYYASDGTDHSNIATATIIVTPVNDAPIAVNDQLSVTEDIPAALPVLTNDIDVDDVLNVSMITIVNPPLHGTLLANTTANTITYTPDPDYFGNDSFTYTLKDAAGAVSNTATVDLTINPVNDAPVSLGDGATTAEDTQVAIAVLANDTDIDNAIDVSSVTITSSPAHGTAVPQANGTVIYTPARDYFGSDSFSYSVKDVAGAPSQPATVSITITPVNDAPVAANDDAATTLENTAKDIAILDNDIDVDNTIDPSSVVIVSNPSHGTVNYNASTGIATYTPATDYLGTDQFAYTIQDAAGLVSTPATVSITVVPPNRAPVAVDDQLTHRFVLDVTIDVLANDYDVDNDHADLTIVSVTQPAIGSVSIVDNRLVYHPAGTTSTMVIFTYTIKDPAGLTDEAKVSIEYIYNPLTVSEGFSPNNDANNDTWYILSIENYPNNNVKIYDRWGLIVYQKEHYENSVSPWDGRANIGQQSGKLLDQGTYYYMLETGGELKTLSGYVMIVR